MRLSCLCMRERVETCDCVLALLGPDQSYYVLMTLAHLGCCEILVCKLAVISAGCISMPKLLSLEVSLTSRKKPLQI